MDYIVNTLKSVVAQYSLIQIVIIILAVLIFKKIASVMVKGVLIVVLICATLYAFVYYDPLNLIATSPWFQSLRSYLPII